MSHYQPEHKAETSLLEELENMWRASPSGSHREEAIVPMDEPASPEPLTRGRLRKLGSAVMDRLTSPSVARDDVLAGGLALALYAAYATGVVYLYEKHQTNDSGGETVLAHHYYAHPKVPAKGGTLESLVERYGANHSRWTERHAEQIADDLVNNHAAMTQSHGGYFHYIQYPAEQLKPGEKVQIVRSMLEKPETLGDLPHGSSTH
jgi:hypothetical protein